MEMISLEIHLIHQLTPVRLTNSHKYRSRARPTMLSTLSDRDPMLPYFFFCTRKMHEKHGEKRRKIVMS